MEEVVVVASTESDTSIPQTEYRKSAKTLERKKIRECERKRLDTFKRKAGELFQKTKTPIMVISYDNGKLSSTVHGANVDLAQIEQLFLKGIKDFATTSGANSLPATSSKQAQLPKLPNSAFMREYITNRINLKKSTESFWPWRRLL